MSAADVRHARKDGRAYCGRRVDARQLVTAEKAREWRAVDCGDCQAARRADAAAGVA